MSHVVQNDVHSLGQRVSISSSLSLKDKLAIMLLLLLLMVFLLFLSRNILSEILGFKKMLC